MAVIDYQVALSMPNEALVFLARSIEWIREYFQDGKVKKQMKVDARKLMADELHLPLRHVKHFYKLVNDTVIARHAKNHAKVRPPLNREILFGMFLCEAVLDHFSAYVWWRARDLLKNIPELKVDFDFTQEVAANKGKLSSDLDKVLGGTFG